nr:ribosomal protein L29 [Erythrocladia irregularis]
MGKSKIEELRNLNLAEVEAKIITIKKELFTLRLKKATKQLEKTHLFKEKKNLLAQLLMIENELCNQ